MHRFRLVILLVILFGGGIAPSATAQDAVGGGIVFGANVSTLRTPTADELGYRTAASGGVFGRVDAVGPLAVRTELLFSQKGVRIDTDQGQLTLKINYLELPVLLVGRLPFARSYAPRLLAGPAVGLKLYERRGAPGFSFRGDEVTFKRTDAGMMVGAGASLGGPGALDVEVRYTLGLVDVTRSVPTAPLDETLPADGKNGTWSVILRFDIW